MFNRRLLQATSGGDIPIPVDVPTALFMFPCNVLYCGYNREIEKLPITASIA